MRGVRIERRGEQLAVLELEPFDDLDLSAFTPHERRVAILVLRGMSSAEIARSRRTSPRTIANQLQSIYRKIGVSSRADLALVLAARAAART